MIEKQMKIFRGMLDNPYYSTNIEYKLSITPSAVMKLIAKNTEEAGAITDFLLPDLKKQNIFISRFENDDIFKVSQKWSAKGYSNSFSPWLVGWVTSFKLGSSVSISFEITPSVNFMNKINVYVLSFFTVLISCFFISTIFNGTLKAENFLGVIAIAGFWLFYYVFRKFAFRLGQQEKKALLDFVADQFQPFIV